MAPRRWALTTPRRGRRRGRRHHPLWSDGRRCAARRRRPGGGVYGHGPAQRTGELAPGSWSGPTASAPASPGPWRAASPRAGTGRDPLRVLRRRTLARDRVRCRYRVVLRGLPHHDGEAAIWVPAHRAALHVRRGSAAGGLRRPPGAQPHPSWRSGCARRSAPRRSAACCGRQLPAPGQSVRAGRWSATPATTATHHRPRPQRRLPGRRAARRPRRRWLRQSTRPAASPSYQRQRDGLREIFDLTLRPGRLPAAQTFVELQQAARRHRRRGRRAGRPALPLAAWPPTSGRPDRCRADCGPHHHRKEQPR